jgi:hypothetical protein
MENCELRNALKQRGRDGRHLEVEDAGSLRASKDKQVGRSVCRGLDREEAGADRDACDLAIVEPGAGGGKVDGGSLHAFADQSIGKAGHGVGLEGHGGNPEPESGCHGGA